MKIASGWWVLTRRSMKLTPTKSVQISSRWTNSQTGKGMKLTAIHPFMACASIWAECLAIFSTYNWWRTLESAQHVTHIHFKICLQGKPETWTIIQCRFHLIPAYRSKFCPLLHLSSIELSFKDNPRDWIRLAVKDVPFHHHLGKAPRSKRIELPTKLVRLDHLDKSSLLSSDGWKFASEWWASITMKGNTPMLGLHQHPGMKWNLAKHVWVRLFIELPSLLECCEQKILPCGSCR